MARNLELILQIKTQGKGLEQLNKQAQQLARNLEKVGKDTSQSFGKLSKAQDAAATSANKAAMAEKKLSTAVGKTEVAAKKAATSEKQLNQARDNSVGSLGKINAGLTTIQGALAGAAGAGLVFKQAFDFAKEGAAATQTAESFNRLNESVFQTPDLLEQMTAASRGTISELELMQGLLTLTAGTSRELSQSFAEASPRLLEIAKASNKLNPSLGDTAFLYDSIATGIKRTSPLILDNLGIVVKVGEANEKYAESLGKSVKQLTAEEKQLALLNATLEAGDTLIKQVGGNVDSSTDAYARLEVQIGNVTGGFKQWLADGLLPTISFLSGDYKNAINATIDNNLKGAESLEGMIEAAQRLADYENLGARAFWGTDHLLTDDRKRQIDDLTTAIAKQSDTAVELGQNLEKAFGKRYALEIGESGGGLDNILKEAKQLDQLEKASDAMLGMAAAGQQLANGVDPLAGIFTETAEAAAMTEEEIRKAAKALSGFAETKGLSPEQFEDLAVALGGTGEAIEYVGKVTRDTLSEGEKYQVTAKQIEEVEKARAKAHEEAGEAAKKSYDGLVDEARKAQQAALDLFSALRANSTANFSGAINAGEDEGIFNQELSSIGDKIFSGGRTSQQQSDLKDLQKEYANTLESIREYELGIKGATLSEQKRAEKIADLQKGLSQMGQSMNELESITGSYTGQTVEATINQDRVNQAIYDSAGAAGASAEQLAILGSTLGIFSEEAATAALQSALIQEKISQLAQAYVSGETSISGMKAELANFISEVQDTASITALGDEIEELNREMSGLEEAREIVIRTEAAQMAVDELIDRAQELKLTESELLEATDLLATGQAKTAESAASMVRGISDTEQAASQATDKIVEFDDKLRSLPESVETDIVANAEKAITDIERVNMELDRMPSQKTIDLIVREQNNSTFDASVPEGTARNSGGTFKRGQPILVGDDPSGGLTPYSELIVPDFNGRVYNNKETREMMAPSFFGGRETFSGIGASDTPQIQGDTITNHNYSAAAIAVAQADIYRRKRARVDRAMGVTS